VILVHEVTYDRIERDAQRLAKAHGELRARAAELERQARDLARAASEANRAIGASIARLGA
jgi:hypothetical protein